MVLVMTPDVQMADKSTVLSTDPHRALSPISDDDYIEHILDIPRRPSPEQPAPVADAPVAAAAVSAWTAALGGPAQAAKGDTARIDLITSLEELSRVIRATQADLSVDFDESMRAEPASRGVGTRLQGRGIDTQLGLATGQRLPASPARDAGRGRSVGGMSDATPRECENRMHSAHGRAQSGCSMQSISEHHNEPLHH